LSGQRACPSALSNAQPRQYPDQLYNESGQTERIKNSSIDISQDLYPQLKQIRQDDLSKLDRFQGFPDDIQGKPGSQPTIIAHTQRLSFGNKHSKHHQTRLGSIAASSRFPVNVVRVPAQAIHWRLIVRCRPKIHLKSDALQAKTSYSQGKKAELRISGFVANRFARHRASVDTYTVLRINSAERGDPNSRAANISISIPCCPDPNWLSWVSCNSILQQCGSWHVELHGEEVYVGSPCIYHASMIWQPPRRLHAEVLRAVGYAGWVDWVGGHEDQCSYVRVVLRYEDKVVTDQLRKTQRLLWSIAEEL